MARTVALVRPIGWAIAGMLAACTGDIGSRSGTDMPELPRIDPEEGAPPEPGEEFTCVPDLGTSPPLVRRLTRDEYLTNVERLTGVNVRAEAAGMLPPDAPSEAGFSNYATGLTVQYEHALAYGQLAALAVQAMADERIDRYAPCREARCFEDFISALTLVDRAAKGVEGERRNEVFEAARFAAGSVAIDPFVGHRLHGEGRELAVG
ncbi:MAG: DUF1587 domain-containing protein, partial [Myxococcota bacterium]